MSWLKTWNVDKQRIRHPGYTMAMFETETFQKLVDKLSGELKGLNSKTPFDAVAGSGNSGALLCAALQYKIGVPIITVRKEREEHCSGMQVTGHYIDSRYVILDDLISSGRTMRRIINSIREARGGGTTSKCVGIWLYNSPYHQSEWLYNEDGQEEYKIPCYFTDSRAL